MPKKPVQSNEEFKPTDEEPLGAYIRRVRISRHMRAVEVVMTTMGLPPDQRWSTGFLSQVELGRVAQPSRSRLESLAKVLDVPAEWLLEKARLAAEGAAAKEAIPNDPLTRQIAQRAAELAPEEKRIVLNLIRGIADSRHKS
jgi:transcriptional regulator with XRE-family HTH domain